MHSDFIRVSKSNLLVVQDTVHVLRCTEYVLVACCDVGVLVSGLQEMRGICY